MHFWNSWYLVIKIQRNFVFTALWLRVFNVKSNLSDIHKKKDNTFYINANHVKMDKKVTKQIKKYIDKDDVKSIERLLKRRLGKTQIDPVNICVIGERQELSENFWELSFVWEKFKLVKRAAKQVSSGRYLVEIGRTIIVLKHHLFSKSITWSDTQR